MNPINTGLLVTNERNWRAQQSQGKNKKAAYTGPSNQGDKNMPKSTRVVNKAARNDGGNNTTPVKNCGDKKPKKEEKGSKVIDEKKKKNIKCEIM